MANVQITMNGPVVTITLNRPELHNAFDAALIAELTAAFGQLAADPAVRAVVLTGAGASFCAGADLAWMRSSLEFGRAENVADAERLAAMFEALNTLPKPVI